MSSGHETFEDLLAYLRDELGPEDRAALEARLIEDEALRRAFLEISTEEAALTDWAKAERASATLDNETFSANPFPNDNTSRLPTARPLAGWWAAAAILVISALGFFLVDQNSSARPTSGVAHLVASVDAQWQGAEPLPNHPMTTGSHELKSGAIDLLFSDGARVTLSGPSRFDLRSSRHIHLRGGNLVAQIPDEALGFVVTSPQSEVVDLGTEFGLSVDDNGLTDVHVLDGLVEVLPPKTNYQDTPPAGVLIHAGEARRFSQNPDINATRIPVSSRSGLIDNQRARELELNLLRGSVRVVDTITENDFHKVTRGRNWIDLVAEQKGVTLTEPLTVSITEPGSYRYFVDIDKSLAPVKKVNSYLLHFRPSSTSEVSGVISFDQPIVAILCTGDHLYRADPLFRIPSVFYPRRSNPFRGMEPNGLSNQGNSAMTQAEFPDEIVLSQDRKTVSIRTYAGIEKGYDQIRILTLSE